MKTVDFSETIAASDLKVGRSRHLIEFMKVQGCVHTKSKTGFSQQLLCSSEPNFVIKLSCTRK